MTGAAAAQTTSSVSFTIVNNYPVSLTSTAAPYEVSPQSTPTGQPYSVTITQGTGGAWLTTTATQGTTGSTSFTLAVSATANTLGPGQYTSTVTVSVGPPTAAPTSIDTIDVTLIVDAEASLTVTGTPALVSGGFTLGPHYQEFTTPGTQVLNLATVSSSAGAPATPATGTITNAPNANTPAALLTASSGTFATTGTTTTVPVSFSYSAAVANKLAPGTYGGTVTVTVTQSGVSTAPQSVAIPWTLVIEPEPTITPTPSSLALNVPATGSGTATIAVTASQGIPITASASSTGGWLTVTSAPATANTSSPISITANSAGLAVGGYTGSVTITSASASNSPVTVPVTLTVLAPAISSLSPSTVVAGSAGFTLIVSGSNFVTNSQIVFGGTPLATTFVNSGSLTAAVSASQVATVGAVSVTVVNNGQPSATSSPATFTVSSTTTTPTITPPLQSSLLTATSPTLGNAITSGTNITGFKLYINGSFNTDVAHTVVWTNTATNVTTTFTANSESGGILSISPTQIIVEIPSSLFSALVTAPQTVNVTVTEQFITSNAPPPPVLSNAAPFTINPPLTSLGPVLPTGTVGTPYSTALFTGGTPPFTASLAQGSVLPPGLALASNGQTLSGTPSTAGGYTFTPQFVDAWGNTLSPTDSLQVIVAVTPVITSLVPPYALAGGTGFTLTVNGSGFVSGAQIVFGGAALATTFVSAGSLTAPVPASAIAKAGPISVTVVNPSGIASAPVTFTSVSKLTILTPSLPAGQTGAPYSFTLSATGGLTPYTWSVTGLPSSLTLNPSTGVISGTWNAAGNYTVTITVNDSSGQTASSQSSTSITTPPIPLQIITASPLPQATVGVGYGATIFANGGTAPYNFSFTGTPPPGLAFTGGASNAAISGTPTTAGQYSFTVTVTDSANGSASKAFVLVVAPAALTLTGTVSDSTVGAALSDQFSATGGVPPYFFTASGSLPTGTTFNSVGALAGTLTAVGTFTFTVTVTDSVQSTVSKSFTIHVTVAALTITTASLPNGQVGVAYSASVAATGGVQPYTWSIGGLPAGVSGSASGAIGGTPTTAGPYSVSVTVTDSAGAKASQSYTVTISAPSLVVTTTSLPGGTVGAAYSAALAASGGVQPYTWTAAGLPAGLSVSATGAITGTPTAAGTSTVGVTVTDSKGTTASASFTVTITTAPLTITTASLSGGVVGTAVSVALGASGGVPPYTWAVTGLPAGVTVSASGAISGTPTAPGSFTVTVKVTDSAGNTASASLSWTIALPSAPPLTFSGLPTSTTSASQSTLQAVLGSAYPVDVTVTLTLTFTPTSGVDDPSVQFSTGGRTATITVPAGQTAGATTVGVQTGTVAGAITITAQLTAAGQNVTPSPAPSTTIQIAAAVPVITSVTAAATSTGFTVTVMGYSNTRDVSQGVFVFTAASGANLQTGQLTVTLSSAFSAWWGSSAAAPYGGQFTLTQPFTVTGSQQAVTSVAVTLTNSVGTSKSVSATVP